MADADDGPPDAGIRTPSRLRISAAGMVARGRELATTVDTLQQAPAVVVIEGESGIGKTRLVSEVCRDHALADRRVMVGRCRRIGEPFPLGPIVEALRGQSDALAAATLSPVAGVLHSLMPELSPVLPAAPAPLDDKAAERHQVFRGVVEVLDALGEIVLALEDLHWADEQTIEFIGYLLSDPPPKLSLMVTFRDDEVTPSTRTVTSHLPAAVHRAHLTLTPLDRAATRELAEAILEADSLTAEFAGYLWERTGGLPFAIEELLALLRSRGTLARHGDQWVRRALDELDVPDRIRDAVLERAGRLSASARVVVDAAAVLQTHQPPIVLAQVAGGSDDELVEELDEALRSGLIVEDGAGIGFRHLLAAQAVYDAIPGPRRRQAHARAAAALAAVELEPVGETAYHLRQAGRLTEWARAAERAADKAIELRHDALAVRLLAEVLREAPLDQEARERVALKLGDAAVEAIHAAPDVTGLLSAVIQEPISGPARGELALRLSVLMSQIGGDPDVRRQLYRDAVPDLDHRPDLQAWAMVGLGIPTVPGVPPAEHAQWLHRALEVVEHACDPVARTFVWGKAAMVMVAMGDPTWRTLVDRITRETDATPLRRGEVNAYESIGVSACYAGQYALADRLLEAALRGAAACESHRLEIRVRRSAALLDYCRGSWDGLADQVADLATELGGYPAGRLAVESVAAGLALARGDLDAARAGLTDVVPKLEELTEFDLLPLPAGALVRLLTSSGELGEAAAVGERAIARAESMGLWVPALRVVPSYVEALTAAGRLEEARDVVRRVADELQGLDAPAGPAVLAHAQGHLAAAIGDSALATAEFAAAAAAYESVEYPYEAAQAGECAGSLKAALATYRRLGADWDLNRATQRARRAGVSVPARHRGGRRGYGSELSPREREVAELAAIGRTNDEIARELFVSVKTVEKHLSAARRKLNAPTRVALAHQLAAESTDQKVG